MRVFHLECLKHLLLCCVINHIVLLICEIMYIYQFYLFFIILTWRKVQLCLCILKIKEYYTGAPKFVPEETTSWDTVQSFRYLFMSQIVKYVRLSERVGLYALLGLVKSARIYFDYFVTFALLLKVFIDIKSVKLICANKVNISVIHPDLCSSQCE